MPWNAVLQTTRSRKAKRGLVFCASFIAASICLFFLQGFHLRPEVDGGEPGGTKSGIGYGTGKDSRQMPIDDASHLRGKIKIARVASTSSLSSSFPSSHLSLESTALNKGGEKIKSSSGDEVPPNFKMSSSTETFLVRFTLNNLDGAAGQKGNIDIEVHPIWSPLGAQRFAALVEADFFPGVHFFRVISNFVAQFGIHGDPQVSSIWSGKRIQDDPVIESNLRGYLSFATSGKNTRTTQMFINFGDNKQLDSMGFSPFAGVWM